MLAAIALPAWMPLAREHHDATAQTGRAHPVRVSRHPVAWALAVYFGLQSTSAYVIIGWLPQIYRDAGLSADKAGLLFAATSLAGRAAGLRPLRGGRPDAQPEPDRRRAGRLRHRRLAGLWWDPAAAPWLWAILLGVVNTAFPLVLTMIGLRGSTPATVVRLSAFAQGVGYLLAIPGPILVGLLHDHTNGWRVPLALMIALMIPQGIAGVAAGRNRQI